MNLAERPEFLVAFVRSGNVQTKFPEEQHQVGARHGGVKKLH